MWCRFLGSTQPLLPAVSAFLPLSMEITTYLLASAVVRDHIHSIVFFKPTVSIRPPVPPSGSQKLSASDSAFWPTLCTLKDFTYLLTYLLTACICISVEDWTAVLPEQCVTHVGRVLVRYDCASTTNCTQHGWSTVGEVCQSDAITNAVPDVFLLSCILFLGTFSVAYFLKTFRTSAYFPTKVSSRDIKSHPLSI